MLRPLRASNLETMRERLAGGGGRGEHECGLSGGEGQGYIVSPPQPLSWDQRRTLPQSPRLFRGEGAKSLTRPPTVPGWMKKGLQIAGNPTPGPSQPSSSSSWGEAESGSPANQQLPLPSRGPRLRMCGVANACGSHPTAQSEMKDKWLLHLSQIAFFGLSLAIWHGFLGWGGLLGNCMLLAQSCAGWRRWGEEVWIAFRPPGPPFAAEQALARASKSRLNVPCGI